ncbi:hypothetical protein [Parasediminibacterium sp. JCM 36343]|uniref:hypothetical protein n=1 Tax=Parasediminibacterium sp. JCM 36343 TaxID=3374279 RepID=UPI00397D57B9
MTNSHAMQGNFERDKNIKAAAITLLFCLLLFLVFFFVHWAMPQTPPPPISATGIEVNLGNSETGSGDVAPQTPGEPSKEAGGNTPPSASQPEASTTKPADAVPDENDVPVNKPTTSTVSNTAPNTKPSTIKKTVSVPTPPVPVAKATMGKFSGGNGPGGNNAEVNNHITNQGITGGKGDQGSPNGNPNSQIYNSANGRGGISIRSGLKGRKINKYPSFEDDFNEPAKVAVDITVDMAGNVTNAVINPKGTTTTNPNIRGIALRKAKELKLNATTDDVQDGTIVFNFKIRE